MTQKRRVGRPPLSRDEPTVPTMIRLPSSLREVVSTEAERRDVPVGALLREMVEKQVAQECVWDEALFKSIVSGEELELQGQPSPIRWRRHA